MSEGREPDVLMDPDTLDLPDFTRHEAGMAVIAQRVRTRLLTHKGDWPLDITKGINWIFFLAQKPLDLAALAAIISLEIQDTPGVSQVQSLEWEQVGRTATITATVLTLQGESLSVIVSPQDSTGNPSIVVGGVLGHSFGIRP